MSDPLPRADLERLMSDHGKSLTDPITILAMTADGENAAGGSTGMQSVLNVVINRARRGRWWGHTPVEVCLCPWQFSCWLPGPDLDRMLELGAPDADYRLARELASRALAGELPDLTEDADHYFAVGAALPSWADPAKFTVRIEGQDFYRLDLPAPGE